MMIPAAVITHRGIMVRSSSPPPSFLMPLTDRFFPLVGRCSRQVPYGDGNQHPPYGYCHRDGHLKVTVLPNPITPSTQEDRNGQRKRIRVYHHAGNLTKHDKGKIGGEVSCFSHGQEKRADERTEASGKQDSRELLLRQGCQGIQGDAADSKSVY